VVLAVLAAIYLPLTLVTGIFGMNINEINQGVPDRFWVVKVWSWVSSVTVLPILIYAIVRWVIKRVRNGRKGSKDKSVDPEALKLD
jgi:Mg2+ and Co2+ transporter CorA